MRWTPSLWLNRTLQTWETKPGRGWLWSSLWLALVTGIAFVWHLGSFSLVDETEPLFAEAARQMLVRQDWVTPYFNDATRFDKPPLIYWCMAIAYKLIGVNEWAVRLPSALAGIGLVTFTFYVVRQYGSPNGGFFDRRFFDQEFFDREFSNGRRFPDRHLGANRWLTAWFAAGFLALSGEMIAWGRIGVSDMLLNGCIGAALLCFFMGYARDDTANSNPNSSPNSNPNLSTHLSTNLTGDSRSSPAPATSSSTPNLDPRSSNPLPPKLSLTQLSLTQQAAWYWAFYGWISLGILTKGPVAIVLPGFIIGAFLLYVERFWTVVREMRPVRGMGLILLITLPWHGLVIQANGQAFIRSFFGYHNVERFTQVVNNHSAPWYFYIVVVLLGFAPWSIYLPLALGRTQFWQVRRWRKAPRSQHLGLFALWWFVGIFGFFTIAVTKLPSYVLPLMPAAAILVALLWSSIWTEASPLLGLETNLAPETTPLPAPDTRPGTEPTTATTVWAPPPLPGVGICGWLNGLFLLILAVGFFTGPIWTRQIRDPAMPNLPQALAHSGLLNGGGLILLTMALGVAGLTWRRQLKWLWLVNLLGFAALMLFTLLPTLFLLDYHRQLPLRQIGETLQEQRLPGEELIMMGFEKPSIVFYSEQSALFFRRYHSSFRHIYSHSLAEPEPDTLLLLTYPRRLPAFGLEPGEYESLRQAGAYELVRINKQVFVTKPSTFPPLTDD